MFVQWFCCEGNYGWVMDVCSQRTSRWHAEERLPQKNGHEQEQFREACNEKSKAYGEREKVHTMGQE